MTVSEAMKKIEGHRFSAITNLASDFRTFLSILVDQAEVRALATAMKSESVTEEVFIRIMQLADATIEEGYEHPADAAMATYLWLLSEESRDFSEIAAETVLSCKQCWWSRKMAEHVRNAARYRSGAGVASKVIQAGGMKVDYTAHALDKVTTIRSMQQMIGRVNRAKPGGTTPHGGIIVYPVEVQDMHVLFQNHQTRNHDRELLAGRRS